MSSKVSVWHITYESNESNETYPFKWKTIHCVRNEPIDWLDSVLHNDNLVIMK